MSQNATMISDYIQIILMLHNICTYHYWTLLDKMSLPNIWKTTNVSSIFKKGDKSDPSNYRPISLTCVACKIMESIIKDVVMTYLLENNLLRNCQLSFVCGRSVQLQLLSLLNHWADILDSGHTIDVIYLDFKKAFDSVPHMRLLSKLHSYGFCDPLLGWHTLLDDDKGFVSMILYLCGIMSPVAYLKEVFSDLSSFYCISMTYPTMSHQMYICLPTTQKYTAL